MIFKVVWIAIKLKHNLTQFWTCWQIHRHSLLKSWISYGVALFKFLSIDVYDTI